MTRGLWNGVGKPGNTDRTRSGYEYSVARCLLRLGYTDVSELATILALRPEGSVRKSGKDQLYALRTVGNALIK